MFLRFFFPSARLPIEVAIHLSPCLLQILLHILPPESAPSCKICFVFALYTVIELVQPLPPNPLLKIELPSSLIEIFLYTVTLSPFFPWPGQSAIHVISPDQRPFVALEKSSKSWRVACWPSAWIVYSDATKIADASFMCFYLFILTLN